jgi:predicted transcriptional regulator of viral defense system
LVTQLKELGLLAEVENGKYLVLGFEPERVLANPLFIASQLVTPGYVSFWSALHYYGFTEQAPLTVFIATTVKKRPVDFRDQRFRFVTLQPRKLFGYRRETAGGLPVLLADEAKAIVDSLAEPRYAGGVAEVARALRSSLPQVEIATLIEYANRMGDKSLGSRLGFLLARLGQPLSDDELIHAASPVKLDPSRPADGVVDSHWRVDVNLAEAELYPEGVG